MIMLGIMGASFSATVSPTAAGGSRATAGSVTTNTVTVTPSGGTSPYTYAWTWFSGGTGITITSPSAATTDFSGLVSSTTPIRSGTARCTVTDSASRTTTVDVPVELDFTG